MPPNIIEIIWRGLGDWLGCYDRPDVDAPVLDAFAAEGALLESHFSPAPQSSPARASLKTGRYPQSHGILGLAHRGWRYRQGERDLPELLRGAGYHTALIGFQHERSEPDAPAYDERLTSADARGQAAALDAEAAALAAAFLRRRAGASGPFFLSIGFCDPQGGPDSDEDPLVAGKVRVPGFLPDQPLVRRDMAAFYQRIRRADAAVGQVLAVLGETGLAEHTLVYFTTDHGPALPRAKMTLYDPGIKVAFVCRWPGVIPPGRRLLRLTSHVDVLPTLLEVAGVATPASVEGRSFLQRLRGERGSTRDAVFSQVTWHGGEYDPMRCVRSDGYKYIRNYQPGWPVQIGGPVVQRYGEAFVVAHFAHPRPAEELYDLFEDPWEQHNLVEDAAHESIRMELAARLDVWMEAVDDPLLRGPVPFPDPAGVGSDCVWVKAPPHDPGKEAFRWAILRQRAAGGTSQS